ncbi:MAG: hypothetical protein ACK5NK_03210 [Niabella sp.]
MGTAFAINVATDFMGINDDSLTFFNQTEQEKNTTEEVKETFIEKEFLLQNTITFTIAASKEIAMSLTHTSGYISSGYLSTPERPPAV